MLARPYLIILYIIFPIHVNFPITSRCVLKATIHRKKLWIKLCYLRKFFFSKRCFCDIEHTCCICFFFILSWSVPLFMFLYLSFINYFRHITFFICSSFSTFIRDFSFDLFSLINLSIVSVFNKLSNFVLPLEWDFTTAPFSPHLFLHLEACMVVANNNWKVITNVLIYICQLKVLSQCQKKVKPSSKTIQSFF